MQALSVATATELTLPTWTTGKYFFSLSSYLKQVS